MKTRKYMVVSASAVVGIATGCASRASPALADELTNVKPTLQQIDQALGTQNHYMFRYMCRPPRNHLTPHMVLGDGFSFGLVDGRWYLRPSNGLQDRGWKAEIELTRVEGKVRTSFYSGCEDLLSKALYGQDLSQLQTEDIADNEYWKGEIGDLKHQDGSTACHEIRLHLLDRSEATFMPELRGKNFFLEIEKCNHNWDGTAALKQTLLWHGGIYHGTE